MLASDRKDDPSTVAPAAAPSCNVYRIKHNPSWTKFGAAPQPPSGPPPVTSPLATTSPFSAAASPSQASELSGLATVAAQAALRHEHQQHLQPGRTSLRAGGMQGTPRSSRSPASCSVTPSGARTVQETPVAGEDAVDAQDARSGGSVMERASSVAASQVGGTSASTTRPPSSLTCATASTCSRAKQSHLMGSAAVVEMAGPLDSFYVPLRRPAPHGSAASKQHFSIFDGGKPIGGPTAQRAVLRARHAEKSDADMYRTSNGAYGQGTANGQD